MLNGSIPFLFLAVTTTGFSSIAADQTGMARIYFSLIVLLFIVSLAANRTNFPS